MNKKQYTKFLLEKVGKLQVIMKLSHYKIAYENEKPEDTDAAASMQTNDDYLCAYLRTDIDYHLEKIKEGNYKEVVSDFVHELAHIYTLELSRHIRVQDEEVARVLSEKNTELITRTIVGLLPNSFFQPAPVATRKPKKTKKTKKK